jgi:hypothetical protein
MHIYLARSIRGDQRTDTNFVYALRRAIKKLGHQTQFDIDHEMSRVGVPNDVYIYKRDVYWMHRCQAMIAEVTHASLGVGYEIAYALHVVKMPIFAVAQKDANVSAMITGCMPVLQYRDLSDMMTYVELFLEEIHA